MWCRRRGGLCFGVFGSDLSVLFVFVILRKCDVILFCMFSLGKDFWLGKIVVGSVVIALGVLRAAAAVHGWICFFFIQNVKSRQTHSRLEKMF